jgi:hypothetical protein
LGVRRGRRTLGRWRQVAIDVEHAAFHSERHLVEAIDRFETAAGFEV